MQGAYSVATIRAAESAAIALSGEDALMQRAAAALASVCAREVRERRGWLYAARVLLAVGSGNNGGDALFAGARLARRGVAVSAWRPGSGVHRAGWQAFLAAGGRELDADAALAALASTDLVIDGVTGIGGQAGLRAPVAVFARACAEQGVPVVAVDLPSGIPADLPFVGLVPAGEQTDPVPVPEPARSTIGDGLAAHFTAEVTVTFGGLKACHVIEPARSACGRIEVVDIGLPPMEPDLVCWQPADVEAVYPTPTATSDKYSRGVVGVDAGSLRYPGAGVLAVTGAVRAGAGMVRYLGPTAPRWSRQPWSAACRWWWTPTRSACCRTGCTRRCCSLRTPANSPGYSASPASRWWPIRSPRCGTRWRAPGPPSCSRAPPSWWRRPAEARWRSPCPVRPGRRRPVPVTCSRASAGRCWPPA